MVRRSQFLAFLVLLLSTAGCSTSSYQSFKTVNAPDIQKIYKEAAEHDGAERDPVIVIPGFLGSRLLDPGSGQLVWGSFDLRPLKATGERLAKGPLDPQKGEGARLLAIPMEQGKDLKELRSAVVPDGVLTDLAVNFIGLPLRVGAYSYIMQSLGNGGYLEERSNIFQFDYDWRRDLVENAKRLHEFIQAKRSQLQKEYEVKYGVKDPDIRFDIVAHSMAGLLSRYYLLYGDADLPEDGSLPRLTWKGSRWVRKLIVVGTPNAGMLDAFTELVGGIRFAPLLPKFKYEPALLGTWPAYYELLPYAKTRSVVSTANPRGTGLDLYDPELWVKMKWGLADPRQDKFLKELLPGAKTREERRQIAIDHLRKCLKRARQVSEALSVNAKPPGSLRFHLFAGDAVPTKERVLIDRKTGQIKTIEYGPGDGVVLRSSALFDERAGNAWVPRLRSPIPWSSTIFLFGAHMAITRDPTFTDNVLFLLLEGE